MLKAILRELGYMGFRTSKYCRVDVDSQPDSSSILLSINGLTRVKKINEKELEKLRGMKPSQVSLYVERRLFRILIWRVQF